MASGKQEEQNRAAQRAKEHHPANPDPAIGPPAGQIADLVAKGDGKATTGQQAASNQNQRIRQRCPQWAKWPLHPRRLSLIFSGCVAFFAAVQALTSYLQWSATRDQYNAMVDQLDIMQLDQRAWLGSSGYEFGEVTPLAPLKCTLMFTNTGKTPALAYRKKFVALFPPTIPPNASPEEVAKSRALDNAAIDSSPWQPYSLSVPPAGVLRIRTLEGFPIIGQDRFNAIEKQETKFVVVGIVSYTDIFGNTDDAWIDFEYDPIARAWKSGEHPAPEGLLDDKKHK